MPCSQSLAVAPQDAVEWGLLYFIGFLHSLFRRLVPISGEIRMPVALFEDRLEVAEKSRRIGAVEGAVIEALPTMPIGRGTMTSPASVRTTAGRGRIASVDRIATCGALMIGVVNSVPKAPLLLIE